MVTDEEIQELSPAGMEIILPGALAAQTSSEIDRQIATGKRFPRSLDKFEKQAARLIALDKESAAACIYAIPRGKEQNPQTGRWEQKIIKGPTARFAESIVSAWGNCRCRAFIVGEDDQFITAQGIFFDVETNTAISCEVKRRIVDSEGRRYSPDLIVQTANAAASIALRNAILKGIPQPVWKKLYLLAEQTIMGDHKTLADSRRAMFELFRPYGLTPPMVCQLVGAPGPSEIVGEHLVTLQGILTALRDGEVSVEALLAESQDKVVARKGEATLAEIKAKYQPAPEVKAAAQAAQVKVEAKRAQGKRAEPSKMTPISAVQIGFDGTNMPMPEEKDKEPF